MKPTSNNERAMPAGRQVFRIACPALAGAFASVYPHYVTKVERKGRTVEELYTVTHWLTGYTEKGLQKVLDSGVDFETFFAKAPKMNPNVSLITGVICGYRVEDIADPLMQKIRYLDKPVCRQAGWWMS